MCDFAACGQPIRSVRSAEFLKTNAAFRRYVLRELQRRGPLLARELEDRSSVRRDRNDPWWGSRNVGTMLEILERRGEVAIVGRRGRQRLWDLGSRWYPDCETMPARDADALLDEQRFRALGVRLAHGEWHAHPDADDAPVDERSRCSRRSTG